MWMSGVGGSLAVGFPLWPPRLPDKPGGLFVGTETEGFFYLGVSYY